MPAVSADKRIVEVLELTIESGLRIASIALNKARFTSSCSAAASMIQSDSAISARSVKEEPVRTFAIMEGSLKPPLRVCRSMACLRHSTIKIKQNDPKSRIGQQRCDTGTHDPRTNDGYCSYFVRRHKSDRVHPRSWSLCSPGPTGSDFR